MALLQNRNYIKDALTNLEFHPKFTGVAIDDNIDNMHYETLQFV